MPTSPREALSRRMSTSVVKLSVSPWKTGLGNLTSVMPRLPMVVSLTETPIISPSVKMLLTSGLPHSLCRANSWSMCSGWGLWVRHVKSVLSISVTVRRSACSNLRPTSNSSRYRPCMPLPRILLSSGQRVQGGSMRPSPASALRWLPRLLVGIDERAGRVGRRGDHHLGRHILELHGVVAPDVLELHLQHARLGPLAALAKFDVAEHGLERRLADVVGELGVIEAPRGLYGLLQDLHLRVGLRRHIIAERIHTGRRGPRLIALHQLLHAREQHLGDGEPEVVVGETVEQRPQLRLDGGVLQSDHTSADQLGLEADLVDCAHHADRVRGL